MKVLVAGASGTIGQPLLGLLIRDGHDVYGITQSTERALMIAGSGAKPLILNVLDQKAIESAMKVIKPDVVIDMLTHLPKEYTPQAMAKAFELDAKIRLEGGANLQACAEAVGSTKRYIVQSSAFSYAFGKDLADETIPLAGGETPIAAGAEIFKKIEQRVLESAQLEGVALRFGIFYGPRTWFEAGGSVARQVKDKNFCIIGKGEGVWSFVHIEDAAKAVAASLYCFPGAYNIVNNFAVQQSQWLPAFSRYLGIHPPARLSEEEGLSREGPIRVYYATKLRGASNVKAKKAFDFEPRTFEWFL